MKGEYDSGGCHFGSGAARRLLNFYPSVLFEIWGQLRMTIDESLVYTVIPFELSEGVSREPQEDLTSVTTLIPHMRNSFSFRIPSSWQVRRVGVRHSQAFI